MVASLGRKRARCGLVAEAVDHPRRHVVDREEGRGRDVAARQRLEDDRRVEPAEPAPPISSSM